MHVPRFDVPQWGDFGGLVHGFLGRPQGPGLTTACAQLFPDSEDELASVKRNWCTLKTAAGLSRFTVVTARQVHGDAILKVPDGAGRHAGVGDGLMTDAVNVVVGVTAADCVPILLLEPARRVAAAVHAGWRGTAAGIAAKVVAEMQGTYRIDPSALHAALGPSIGPCCYEVGREVAAQIERGWKEALWRAWRPNGARGYLDLRALNRAQLVAAGVPEHRIAFVGPCTACHVDWFFSYRKEGRTGSQLSFIGWRA
jgi:hypothetical protein